jgi:hypothetical protein
MTNQTQRTATGVREKLLAYSSANGHELEGLPWYAVPSRVFKIVRENGTIEGVGVLKSQNCKEQSGDGRALLNSMCDE